MLWRVQAPKEKKPFVTPNELGKLLRQIIDVEPQHAPVVLAYVLTGARLAEIKKLTWGEVDLDRSGMLRLSHTATRAATRGTCTSRRPRPCAPCWLRDAPPR